MNQHTTLQRNVNLDILRIFACLLVVLSHTSSELAVNAPLTSFDGSIAHIMNTIGHTGTILFLFISGSLLLSEDYHFVPRKFYTRNFLRLFIAYYSWIVIYHLVGLLQRGIYTPAHIKEVILGIIKGEASYHFWYLPMLLGIYLLLPFLRAICHQSKALVTYFVVLFLVVQVGFHTLLIPDFPFKYLLKSLLTRLPLTLINHYVGYFVLGYFLTYLLREARIKHPHLWGWILVLAGPVLGFLGDLLLLAQQGYHNVAFHNLFSLALCSTAVGIYLLFCSRTSAPKESVQTNILRLSRLTFGIYMLHPMILNALNTALASVSITTGIPGILVMTLLSFTISAIVTAVLCLIPFIRRWILFA